MFVYVKVNSKMDMENDAVFIFTKGKLKMDMENDTKFITVINFGTNELEKAYQVHYGKFFICK